MSATLTAHQPAMAWDLSDLFAGPDDPRIAETLNRYYGDSVELDENYRWGWSYIPHFVNSPFYCYAYSFGELLVLALYRMYQEQGRRFIPGYTGLLEKGGSGSPTELLAPLGIDIADPSFWNKGFVEIERLIGKMRELVDGTTEKVS